MISKEKLVKEVQEDFEKRQQARKALEAKWLLNLNFMLGNQYSELNSKLDLVDYGKRYQWEEREVYNHIAPIIESRLAKFTRVNCSVVVRPSSGEDKDVDSARLSTKIIESTFHDNDFVKLFGEANYWAELTGSVFYKVMWDEEEESVKLQICPPYEIYPDSLSAERVEDICSLIHARAYPVKVIEEVWGVKVKGEKVDTLNGLGAVKSDASKRSSIKAHTEVEEDYQIVIERYERPSKEKPNGALTIVAGDELLFEGELPYLNGENGKRSIPFIKQVSLNQPCSFFGSSIIERLIPVQRAYNAVKNRKHEYMSRLSVGVLAVEEGSIDIESLEEEGLEPGKVIIYRQGATPPMLMHPGTVPQEFRDEEDRLLMEFRSISGISDGVQMSSTANTTVSGYALSLLIEQDYNRLSVTTESIRGAVKEIAKMILRLYKSSVNSTKLLRISGENGEVELRAFKASDLSADDVVMESDSTMVETPATRKSMVLELLNHGLLTDENGIISNRNRTKIIEMLGFGNWESARNDDETHLKKASVENLNLEREIPIKADEVDDHDLHITEHIQMLVSKDGELSNKAKELVHQHLRRHKVLQKLNEKTNGER